MAFARLLPRTATAPFCPTEVQSTVPIPLEATILRRFWRYAGIGMLISVGYMDPGNWATDIEAGSRFGYELLSVVLLSSLVAMLLQTLCVRLGVATGKDLAQLCHDQLPPAVNIFLWFTAEIAIIACDFAEVLGTALALKLLFSLPLSMGILLTACDTVIVLVLQGRGVLRVESIVLGLVATIALAFFAEILFSHPDWHAVASGFLPHTTIFHNSGCWLIAIGIFGATVMPHNLYLHSSAVGTRMLRPNQADKDDAIRLMTWDTLITLGLAFFVNVAILVLAGTVFHFTGHDQVKEIDDAYHLLTPLLGTAFASTLFALALFASGQSSTLTGTMAGQVVLEGFLQLRIPCWKQRLVTRIIAITPAWFAIIVFGEAALGKLLVLSQVVLSMQLPFAVVPLILFNANGNLMGRWKLSRPMQGFCWLICAAIIAANGYLIWDIMRST